IKTRSLANPTLLTQVARGHFPLTPHDLEYRLGLGRQHLLLQLVRHSPKRIEERKQTRRDKRRATAQQLSVKALAPSHYVVLDAPRQTTLRILLHVARHVRVAPATNSDVKRRSGTPRVSQSLTESDVFNEALGGVNVVDTVFRIASPHAIAMDLDLLRKHGTDSIKVNWRTSQPEQIGQRLVHSRSSRRRC